MHVASVLLVTNTAAFYSLSAKRLVDLSVPRAVCLLSCALLSSRTWNRFLSMNGVFLRRSKRSPPNFLSCRMYWPIRILTFIWRQWRACRHSLSSHSDHASRFYFVFLPAIMRVRAFNDRRQTCSSPPRRSWCSPRNFPSPRTFAASFPGSLSYIT